MDPISIGLMGAKFLGGAIQAIRGNRILKKTKLPEYAIPGEFQNNLQAAKNIKTMGGMPGQQYQQAMNNIYRNASFGVSQLQKRNAAIGGVGAVQQRLNDGAVSLGVADANMARQSLIMGTQMETQANTALAGQKLAKQSWEKFNPYLRKINEGQSLVGAGMQNMFGAATGAAQMNMYGKQLGSQGSTGGQFGGIRVPRLSTGESEQYVTE